MQIIPTANDLSNSLGEGLALVGGFLGDMVCFSFLVMFG